MKPISVKSEMAAYDRLPKSVRTALQNAPDNICAVSCLELMFREKWTARALVKAIERGDSDDEVAEYDNPN